MWHYDNVKYDFIHLELLSGTKWGYFKIWILPIYSITEVRNHYKFIMYYKFIIYFSRMDFWM